MKENPEKPFLERVRATADLCKVIENLQALAHKYPTYGDLINSARRAVENAARKIDES